MSQSAFDQLRKLADEQAKWSQETFGSDETRGPVAALKHLALEVQEALEQPDDASEYADCFLLIIDASRRAGISISELLQHASDKLEVCKQRDWPKPTSPDEPVQHLR